jgi:outer membrane protein assembly factor BamD
MSYLRQMRPFDRDQGASGNAHAYFRAVMDRYPGTPWAERASLRLRECDEALAAHELYVARFYLRQANLSAAESRLSELLEDYAHTDATREALYLFAEEYLKRGLDELSELALLALITHYPDTPLARRAGARLTGLSHSSTPLPWSTAARDPLGLLLLHLTERRLGMSEP